MAVASDTALPAALESFAARHRFKAAEALPWLVTFAGYFLYPDYLALGSQILATILFALSLDLVLGYAGIVTLGHAAFFGTGAYAAGILAANGWGEPITGLLAAGLAAGLVGLLSGALILRTTGLTLLMQTLVVAAMLGELANKASFITGGSDGLQGMQMWSIFGEFRFDLFYRTAYIYCAIVTFLGWLVVRAIVHSSFGRSLTGIRENMLRMHAVGSPVAQRKLVAYTISAALAGISGGLIAQTTGLVGLGVLALQQSGTVLIMLIIGGIGQLYGAFIGVPLYMIAQDRFSEIDPIYWYFWIGEFLVLLVVFARGGMLGLPARVQQFAGGVIAIMLGNGAVAQLYETFIGEAPDTSAPDPISGIIPIKWYIWIGELAALSLVLKPDWPLRLPARIRQFAKGAFTDDGAQTVPLLRGAATGSILIALNLWIALDAAGGALGSRWLCLLWPVAVCRGSIDWLVPLLAWLGLALLGAAHALRWRAAKAG
jgi:branched-chain amino acid transport system permease protein